MKIGIDATNIGYGGGIKHIQELLSNFNPLKYPEVENVIIWGNENLNDLPNYTWLVKRSQTKYSIFNIINKIIWDFHLSKREFTKYCDILFSPSGTFYSKKIKYISMSQNMLIFDRKESSRYGKLSLMNLKFIILYFLQKRSFENADGVIFISKYAQKIINKKILINNQRIIYHGNSEEFDCKLKPVKHISNYSTSEPYKLIYVSAIRPYKHHWLLIKAVSRLREEYPIELTIIGQQDDKNEIKRFNSTLNKIEDHQNFIKYLGPIESKLIPSYLHKSDMFIMQSTCENMPNVVIEAMSSGLSIASSNYEPMPEFLLDSAFYFNPLNVTDVIDTIKSALLNPKIREDKIIKAKEYVTEYSWSKCSNETFEYLIELDKNKK